MLPGVSSAVSPPPSCTRIQLGTLLTWHARYGRNPSSLVGLDGATHALTVPGVPGGLAVQYVGRVVLTTGDPLAPPEHWPALYGALLTWCQERRLLACAGPVGAEFAAVARTLGQQAVRLGSAPYLHLHDWPPRGDAGAAVRNAVNRAGRDGVQFKPCVPAAQTSAWADEVRQLARRWLSARRAPFAMHWVFDLRPLEHQALKQYVEARQHGRLVALIAASPLPARDGWYLEDIIRTPDAPASVGTALVAHTLTLLRDQGATLATLGAVPLSRQRGWNALPPGQLERLAYRARPLFSRLYAFDGLETFKRRFRPSHWEDEYLVLPPGPLAPWRVGLAVLRMVLRGH